MRQFVTIATNAFMELVRQPIFLLLTTATAGFEIFLATPYYFAFGDEPKLVKNSVLAVMLLAGLFGAVLTASSSLGREIRSGTALAVLSKPIGRAQFLLAKYAGLVAALTLMTYVNLVAALVSSRMAFDAYGGTDMAALGIFAGGILLAYGIGGFSNFFLRRSFVSDAFFALVVTLTVAAVLIFNFTKQQAGYGQAGAVDWRLVPAAILVLFALWILASLALACSTRVELIPTLAICSAISWWASCRITCLGCPPSAVPGGDLCFTRSRRIGNFSGSPTCWKRARTPFPGTTSAKHSATRWVMSAPRSVWQHCCLKIGN